MKNTPFNCANDWTGILNALADENRLQIVKVLLKQEASVNELVKILNINISIISRNLQKLESSGLLTRKKDGRRRVYGLTESLKSRLSDDKEVLDLGCCQFIFEDLGK